MNKYANIANMVTASLPTWHAAHAEGLTGIRTLPGEGNQLTAADGHRFINMCSCSYLGLNLHPAITAGAIQALQQEGMISTSVSRARIAPQLLDETEALLREVFRCETIVTPSCYTASASVLPLLASGHFTGGIKPLMIFDGRCHFSMQTHKACCADETEVVTSPHNDCAFIERACQTHDRVAYICDGAYSMGDNAPLEELARLQQRYGLFLFIDDSHSLSVSGPRGCGLARAHFDELNDHTVIVASLAKAFGATGGLILLSSHRQREMIICCGGPLGWSQMVNTAGLGAIQAAAKLHLGDELPRLQQHLSKVMRCLDDALPSTNAGNGLPIRVFDLPTVSAALAASRQLYQKGFYCSAVFFPIVARDRPGIRAMGRANMNQQDIDRFCAAVRVIVGGT